jgi:hypothetical protein
LELALRSHQAPPVGTSSGVHPALLAGGGGRIRRREERREERRESRE